jgi:hypothetical protein
MQIQCPVQELEQIQSTIQALHQCLSILEARHETLTSDLEYVTRPEPVIKNVSMRKTGRGFEYQGEMFQRRNYIDIHVDLLRRLWTEFPDQRETMAKAISRYGRTRAYVAKTCTELFPNKSSKWTQQYSRVLIDDWYVDTNLNRERMPRILQAAVRAAGLKWGEEVKVYWRSTVAAASI